jgi:uncharacterized protein YbgA (DUF1722 family)
MPSKITVAEIEETINEYRSMLTTALAEENKESISALINIISDLQGFVKYASDYDALDVPTTEKS